MRLLILGMLLLPIASRADVPLLLAHQGYLLGANDQPATTSATMTFGLAAGTATAPHWSETRVVAVTAGYYSVRLGTQTPLNQADLDHAELYLSVTVGTVELTPRVRLSNAPRAASADALRGRSVSGGAPSDGQVLAWNAIAAEWQPSTPAAGLVSLNGETASTQSFTNDTNVTVTSGGGAHALGWTGTLAIARGGTGSATGSIEAPGPLVVRPAAGSNLYLMRNEAGTSWSTGSLFFGVGDVSPNQTLINGGPVFVRNRIGSYDWQITNANAPAPSYLANYPGAKLGIGTSSPTEKLTVVGIIESTSGGIRFPDATLQATAATPLGPASTPELARLGLGVPAEPAARLVANGQIYSRRFASPSTTLDWANGNVQSFTLANGANTLTLANPADGGVYRLIVRQPATGAAGTIPSAGWPSNVAFAGGARPVLSTTNGAVDLLTLVYDASADRYYSAADLNQTITQFLAYAGATHTPADCTTAGGTVTAITGDGSGSQICRFESASCPSGWSASGWKQWAARLGAAAAEQLNITGPCTFITYQNGCNHPTKRFDIPASAWGLNVAKVQCDTSSPVNTCDGACYGGACVTPLLSDTVGAVGCY